jgi:Family of unknown function (DUF6314)
MPKHHNTARLNLFKHLQGVWRLQRRLDTQGYMQGIAIFKTWRAGVLYYQEQGSVIAFGSSKMFAAYRAYAYVYDQGTIAVHFWDSAREQPAELLHTLHFQSTHDTSQTLVATGTHGCANDIYRARYVFVSREHFQLTYQVQGPRKSYTIQTYFSKRTDRGVSVSE